MSCHSTSLVSTGSGAVGWWAGAAPDVGCGSGLAADQVEARYGPSGVAWLRQPQPYLKAHLVPERHAKIDSESEHPQPWLATLTWYST